MSAAEIAHRAVELYKRTQWRKNKIGWKAFDVGEGALPALAVLGERLINGAQFNPALRRRISEETQRLIEGEFILLGQAWPVGTLSGLEISDPHLFLRDPVTSKVWPRAEDYCFNVPYRHVPRLGDIKFLWEINRLQFLQVASAQARLSGDGALSERIFDVFRVWMQANPPFRGPNWISGIELALRIVTVIIVLSFLGEPSTPDMRVRLRSFLSAHAFWLARYPSRYSSANNHRIAEGLGLFLLGALAPDIAPSANYEQEGREILERESQLQIYADGVGVEQSPTYTAFSMEMLSFAAVVARLLSRPLSPAVEDRLSCAAEHLAWLMNENGEVPAIGDNDEGRIIATSIDSEPRYACSVAAMAAGLMGARAQVPGKRVPEIREALMGTNKNPMRLGKGCRTFEHGGYSVVRDELEGRQLILVFDHGPLGYLSIAAHGHSDALAIWLDVAGRPVLVDAGTWLYHAGGPTRDELRMTSAHNTVVIEGLSQSLPAGAFNWSHKAHSALIGCSREDPWWFVAAHDGYSHRCGVRHIRHVSKKAPGEIIISDYLSGLGIPRRASIRFLLAPDLRVASHGNDFIVRRADGFKMQFSGPAGFGHRAIVASGDSVEAWVSQRFGTKVASTALVFDGILGSKAANTRLQLSFGSQPCNSTST